jgi:hypothetical protein
MDVIEELKKEHDLILSFLGSANSKPEDLKEMLQHALTFFTRLKQVLAQGSEEDKKQVQTLMNGMQTALHQNLKRICERVGMNEEQLFKFCENPNNFNSGQWATMAEAKQKLATIGNELRKERKQQVKGGENPFAPAEEERGSSSKGKRTRRKDWMVS